MIEIPGATYKLDIADESVYLTVGCISGRPVYISLVLGHGVNHEKTDADKSMLEVICNQATELLSTGTWTIPELVESWRGVMNCEPSGVCPQLEGRVSSPLDAAARWLGQVYGV